MPLVRIDLVQGTSPEYPKSIADGVHQGMVESLAVPPDDRFQVITEHPPDAVISAVAISALRIPKKSFSCKSL